MAGRIIRSLPSVRSSGVLDTLPIQLTAQDSTPKSQNNKKNGLIAKKIRKKFCGFWFVAHCKSVYIYTFCEYFRGLNETLCIVAGIIEGGNERKKENAAQFAAQIERKSNKSLSTKSSHAGDSG